MSSSGRRLRVVALATLATLAVVAAETQAAPLEAAKASTSAAGRAAGLVAGSSAVSALADLWRQSPALSLAAAGASRLIGWLAGAAAVPASGATAHRPLGGGRWLPSASSCDAGSQMDPNGHCT
jgi:hypothetical protein